MPQISIIVPIYKVDQYLQRCVDSILVQTFTDYELILIDDGSPDQSGQIDDEYAVQDDRIISIHHKNGGVSSARNVGLDIARGEYITFIDPDDYVLPNYLEELFHPEYDLVCQTVVKWDEDGTLLMKCALSEQTYKSPTEDVIMDLLYKGVLNYAPCKCYKAAIIHNNNIRYNVGINLAEDTLFSAQYATYASSIFVQNKSNYQYIRYHSHMTLDGKRTKERMEVILKAYHLISEAISNDSHRQMKIFVKKASIAFNTYLRDNYFAISPFQIVRRLPCLWYLSESEDFHIIMQNGISYGFANEMCAAIQSRKKMKVTFEYIHYCLYLLKKKTLRP